MIARNYVPAAKPLDDTDTHFQAIIAARRRLRPVCNSLATASAVNNLAHLGDIDKGVIYIIRDGVRKLCNTIKTPVPDASQGQPGVRFGQVIVLANLV